MWGDDCVVIVWCCPNGFEVSRESLMTCPHSSTPDLLRHTRRSFFYPHEKRETVTNVEISR